MHLAEGWRLAASARFHWFLLDLVLISLLLSLAFWELRCEVPSVVGVLGYLLLVVPLVGYRLLIRTTHSHRLAENALRDSDERYRSLVDHSPDAIVVHCHGVIEFVNGAALKVMRATGPKDLIGRAVLETVHPDFRGTVGERIPVAAAGKVAPFQEMTLLRLDGSSVDVELVSMPLHTRRGGV